MNDYYIKEKVEKNFIGLPDNIKNHIIETFLNLSQDNNEFITELFEVLCVMKEEHPNFIIKFSDLPGSQFECDSEKVLIGRKNYLILIHEIAHAIHYYYKHYSVPDEFNQLQEELSNNQQIINKCNVFINILDKKINDISTAALDVNISDSEYNRMLLEQKCYLEVEDFIDAFLKGKTGKGHGEGYYSTDQDNSKCFSEMFATYISIRSFDSSGIIIEWLKECLGDYVIDMLEQQYQEIKSQMNINNNIIRR